MTDGRRRATVLAVDDNDGVLNVVESMLRSARFDVIPARSGAAALEIAGDPSVRIDVLLSDVDMPGMCGHTLAGLLRQIRPNVRLVFMSGGNHHLPFDGSEYVYLAKPFAMDELIRKIEQALGANRPDPTG